MKQNVYGMEKPDVSKRFSVHIPMKFSKSGKYKDSISNHDPSSMNDLEVNSLGSSKHFLFKGIGKRSKVASNSDSVSVMSRPSGFKVPNHVRLTRFSGRSSTTN